MQVNRQFRRTANFGQRRRGFSAAEALAAPQPASIANDLRLFAMTFAGGFLFMAIYLA
jgi:hypothetical protein